MARLDLREVMDLMGRFAVQSIQSGRWPVRTGFSKRSFGFRVNAPNHQVVITNRADYAVYVEERTGAAAEALRRAGFGANAGIEGAAASAVRLDLRRRLRRA